MRGCWGRAWALIHPAARVSELRFLVGRGTARTPPLWALEPCPVAARGWCVRPLRLPCFGGLRTRTKKRLFPKCQKDAAGFTLDTQSDERPRHNATGEQTDAPRLGVPVMLSRPPYLPLRRLTLVLTETPP